MDFSDHPIQWISKLKGTWAGRGTGGFPTMDSFEFEDKVTFKVLPDAFEAEGLIHFEEIAWVIESGKPVFKHLETGMLRPLEDGTVEFQVTHNTGRIESFSGRAKKKSEGFQVEFHSTYLRNTPELVKATSSHRLWKFNSDQLIISQSMSTKDIEKISPHLQVNLKRE